MKQALQHIFSLGIKEIVGLFRDPLLVLLIVYSFSISIYIEATSQPDAISHAAIAIVDEDNSPLTKRLSDSFMPPLFLPPVKLSRADIDRMLDEGKFTFVVVFPPKFQERVLADNHPEVQINIDATRMSQAFTGNGYIQEILIREINRFVRESTNAPDVVYTAGSVIRSRFNPNLTTAWEGAVNALVNNVAMLALLLTGAALIRERERGTLEHLMVTPTNSLEIMLSKVWSMSLVVFIATGFSLLFVIRWLMSVPVAGSFWLFMSGVVINLFAMTSLGIFLACFARDMPQLGMLTILVLMPMQILSGGTTPLENMPQAIQCIMHFAPTSYFVKFSNAILFRGADLTLVWKIFLQMFLLGGLYFLVALWRFRKTVSS